MTKSSRKPVHVLFVLLPALAIAAVAAAQDGSFTHPAYSEPGSNSEADRSDLGNVAQTARVSYAEGNRLLKKAAKLEKKLPGLDPAKRIETEAKIAEAFENAAGRFIEAIRLTPRMLDAYTALGETYGRMGKHQQRLQVHAQALKLAPGDEANFRGWAGSLLALDMLGDATSAWEHFSAADPPKADILRDEMQAWLDRHREEPAGLEPAAIERMAEWLAERG